MREGWLVVDMNVGGRSAYQIWNAHNIPISPVYCQQKIHSDYELWGAVAQAHISDARCLAAVQAVILDDGRITRHSVGERCGIVFIMFLFDLLNCASNRLFYTEVAR